MCFKSTEEVAAQLASWKLGEHYKHVYVANRDFSPGKARSLLEAGGFDTVVSAATTCRRQAPGSARSGGAKCGRTPEVGWWSRGRCGLCSAGWCGTAGAAQRSAAQGQIGTALAAADSQAHSAHIPPTDAPNQEVPHPAHTHMHQAQA